ncbi:MAG: hypothetical protein ACE5K4_00285 [Candidatus Hydrothermarchaeota archaeon]
MLGAPTAKEIILVSGITLSLIFLAVYKFGEKYEKILMDLASKLNLNYKSGILRGKPRLWGNYRNHDVRLSYAQYSFRGIVEQYNNFTVKLSRNISNGFTINKKRYFLRLKGSFEIGDPYFDENFTVRFISLDRESFLKEEIKRILDSSTIQKLLELDLVKLEVSSSEISLETKAWNFDQGWITDTLNFCVDLAEKIERSKL